MDLTLVILQNKGFIFLLFLGCYMSDVNEICNDGKWKIIKILYTFFYEYYFNDIFINQIICMITIWVFEDFITDASQHRQDVVILMILTFQLLY